MKKVILLITFVFASTILFSNSVPLSSAYVSELYFDDNGDWTIELYFKYYDAEMDTGYVFITSTDTAFFWKFPDSTNIVVLTMDDLSKNIVLNKEGDMFWFENWIEEMVFPLTSPFVFGDHPDSWVNELYSGQSYIGLGSTSNYWEHRAVKDTSSSLGVLRSPPKGIFNGYIYDSTGIPLPYIRVQTFGIEAKTLWPDENGFFTDTLYAKNYTIFIYNENPNKIYSSGFTIEPDSTTIHEIYLPVSAEIEFSGYCFLVGNDQHTNTTIYLVPQSPFAPNDTITTDSMGFYSKTIPIGHYSLRYSHENYLPYFTYWYKDIFFDTLMSNVYLEEGNVHEIDDSLVSGRWVADYPYWIFTDLTIAENDTLVIDPGVRVIFKRKYQWDVYGTLLAEGTSEDSIFITKNPGSWGSLNFQSETSSGSKLKYTDISFQESISFYNSNASIRKSKVTWNGDLCFYNLSSPHIDECYFDYGVSLVCRDSSAPVITNNFSTNSANPNIFCGDHSTPKIFNNDFFGFFIGIMYSGNGAPEIIGNIFLSGGYAIDIGYAPSSAPTVVHHNIFYDLYDPIPPYDDWIPGFGLLDTINVNGDTCDTYFNLFMDPQLTDPINGDFSLMIGSPCIDAGNPNFPLDPDSTIADIGALYFDQMGVFIHDRKPDIPVIKLYHFPNPATDYVNFVIEGNGIKELENARIKIYDLSGVQVDEFPCPFIDKGFGKKIYSYSSNSLKSGTYLYTFEANGQIISTNKLILVR